MSEHSTKAQHPLHIETFEIEPAKMHKVVLGRFNVGDPKPRFHMVFHERDPETSMSLRTTIRPYKALVACIFLSDTFKASVSRYAP